MNPGLSGRTDLQDMACLALPASQQGAEWPTRLAHLLTLLAAHVYAIRKVLTNVQDGRLLAAAAAAVKAFAHGCFQS